MLGRVWLDGASGFVGRAMLRDLLQRGFEVKPISRTVGDVFGHRTVTPADACLLIGPGDQVICSSGLAHIDPDSATMSAYRNANVEAPLRLAESAVRRGASRFVYLSTVKVLGEHTSAERGFCEDDRANPQGMYAQSKWEAEQALRELGRSSGLETTLIRPPLLYGPGVQANFLAMMRWLHRGFPLPLASIDNRRSLLALDNLVDLVALCLTHPGAAGETFLACDDESVSTPELLRRVAEGLGRRAHLWPCPAVLLRGLGRMTGRGEAVDRLTQSLLVDGTKAAQQLGWHPPVPCRQALEETARAFIRASRSG